MLRKLCLVLMLFSFASPVFGQLNLSYTSFQPGQTISSIQFTANFTAISSNALNRTNGIMTGTLQTQNITVGTNNIYDLASTNFRFRDGYFSRNVDIDGTLDVAGVATLASATVTTLTCTGCVDATQLAATTVTGGSYGSASSVGTFTVDADGRLTAAANATITVASANITDDSIVNADINSAAGIVDTKLATIATAGKVSNSATTATSANTASAIVARDGSGNFSAGTITATLTGNATGSSGSTTGNAATATALQTARTINGVSFNGTANITIGLNAVDLTGTTLASGVTASSLTSLGTITNLTIGNGTAANPGLRLASHTDSGIYAGTLAIEFGAKFDVSTRSVVRAYHDQARVDFLIGTVIPLTATETMLTIGANNTTIVASNSALVAAVSGDVPLGAIGGRWSTVYSVNPDNISSDIRMKENIIDLPYGLETLKKVKVYQYNMIGNSDIQYGVIAQQLQTTELANIIAGTEEDGYGVAYTELIPVLIKAIQELEARVAELENER